MTSFLRAVLPVLLITPLLAATSVSAPQEVPNGELQKFIYLGTYPTWCGDARVATQKMRANPSTDPAFLQEIMVATIQKCANTSYVLQRPPLWNQAVFAGASAALLAARHESPADAERDAMHAKNWSAEIVAFVHKPGPGHPGPGQNIPSALRTDAGRINRDADALLAALKNVRHPSSDNLPSQIPVPHPTPS